MEITNATLEWTPDDATRWELFLKTQTGQRLIPKLVEDAPALLLKGDINEILCRTGALAGFQRAVKALLDLSLQPQNEEKKSELFEPLPPE